MEPLAASNQPLSLSNLQLDETESDQPDGIQLHSRLASAAERLPRFIKAESVRNQLRKHPDGVSEEEMEFTLPNSSLPKTGPVPRAKVQSLIDQNGIKLERKVMGGASQEGSLAKAAREKYLAAEVEHQKALSVWHDSLSRPMTGEARTPLHVAHERANSARDAAYAEMNATAGKPDELVQAEKNYRSALDNFNIVRGYEVKTDPNTPLSPKFIGAANRRQETKRILEELKHKHESSTPRYEQYSTPGGIPGTYQEHLLKVPDRSKPGEMDRLHRIGNGTLPHDPTNPDEVAIYEGRATPYEIERKNNPTYRSVHWPEDPNVIAHWRADDRVGPNGEKVLHVHEVQSDLHQAGRENGYKGDGLPTDDQITDSILATAKLEGGWSKEELERTLRDPGERKKWAKKIEQSRVPNLPFKNNEWANLALKDIMDHAVKNGYDAVQFNNGELAKMYAAGGGGDLDGLKDWYERQIPARMQKMFGLKNDPRVVTIDHPKTEYGINEDDTDEDVARYNAEVAGTRNPTVPFFRLRHNGKLLGNLEKVKKSGMFLMSNQRRK